MADVRREQAIALRKAGLSRSQIARELGLKGSGGKTLDTWLRGVPPPEWTKRPRAKDHLRDRAVELRRHGRSYREIGEELGVSSSSLSLWLRDIALTDTQKERLKDLQVSAVQKRAEAVRANRLRRTAATIAAAREAVGGLTDRELFMCGTALYWAEGSKSKPWSRGDSVEFINSDAGVVSVFLAWLDLLGVSADLRSYRLSIHETADLAVACAFWSEVVGVCRSPRFKSPRSNGTSRRPIGRTWGTTTTVAW